MPVTLYISAQLRQPTTPGGEETQAQACSVMRGSDTFQKGESKETAQGTRDPKFSFVYGGPSSF